MDKEKAIENFVRKRENWRKTSFEFIICLLLSTLVTKIVDNKLSSRVVSICYCFVLLLFLTEFALSFYLGTILSKCPVCQQIIPTTRRRHARPAEKPSRFGNGPLPDYCPHCGANFVQYKTFEFEQ